MKIYKLLITNLFICSVNFAMAQGLGIIPEPYSATKGNGVYTLPKSINISAPNSLKGLVEPIINQLQLVTGKTVNASKVNPTIELSIIKDNMIGNEGKRERYSN